MHDEDWELEFAPQIPNNASPPSRMSMIRCRF